MQPQRTQTPKVQTNSILQEGDRVFSIRTVTGGYAEYCVTDEDFTQLLHEKLTFEEGAGLGVPYYTAYRATIIRLVLQSNCLKIRHLNEEPNRLGEAVVAVIVWQLDLHLPMQSVPITTDVVRSNLNQCEVYNIM